MKKLLVLIMALASAPAFAVSPVNKYIDTLQATGGTALTVPLVGSAVVSDSSTVTLTNKTISGSSNTLSNISTGSLASGFTLPVGNGGTGAVTLTSNGVLFGAGTSSISATSAGLQFQVLQAGSGGTPQFGALALSQSAAVTGQLGVANGGTGAATLTAHGVIVGEGTSALVAVTGSIAGQVLTWNSSGDPSFQAVPSAVPSLNGSAGSPQTISAAGGISLSNISYSNVVFIVGTGAGTTTVTATPSITACTAAGQELRVLSESATNLVKLQNQADLAGSQLLLNGPWVSGMNNSSPYTLTLLCDGAGTPDWVEMNRNN